MKNEKLFTAILDKELTPESLIKLNKLIELVNNPNENGPFSILHAAITEDEIICFIFEYAGKKKKKGINALIKGYLSPGEVLESLHISRRTLAIWRASGILEGRKYHNKYYYNIRKLESLLMKNYISNKPEQSESAGQ